MDRQKNSPENLRLQFATLSEYEDCNLIRSFLAFPWRVHHIVRHIRSMVSHSHKDADKPVRTLEDRIQRKRRRNRLLILFSPILILLSPVLLPVYLVLRKYKKKHFLEFPSKPTGEHAGSLDTVPPAPQNIEEEQRIDALPDTFALCRVVGNDLVPRHRAGQSLTNVKFILENEPEFENCTKLWLLNRIFDPENEANLIALLDQHNQEYVRIPFDADAYQETGYDFETFEDPAIFCDGRLDQLRPETKSRAIIQTYRAKNNYVMNNNGARNAALELCLDQAKWALPLDGNCFFTNSAWNAFRDGVIANRNKRYLKVPMARMQDNADLLTDTTDIQATEEPQMAFRCDAPLRFDERHPYGRRPKVELFLHLGIPGPWANWPVEFFDSPPRSVSPEGHRVAQAGWVARLFSGKANLEKAGKINSQNRSLARNDAIQATLDMLEAHHLINNDSYGLNFYDSARLAELAPNKEDPTYDTLCSAADQALTRYSEAHHDKTAPAPRNQLQQFFNDTTVLALAAQVTGNSNFARKAEDLIRACFINTVTRVSPSLSFAQIRSSILGGKELEHGLTDTKDLYFFLDAVRLLKNEQLIDGLKHWCTEHLNWLTTSDQCAAESRRLDTHGTYFELQTAAVAAFLNDIPTLQGINYRAQARVQGAISADGEQPFEMKGTLTQHQCTLNLQNFINLFDLLENVGFRPWSSTAGERLQQAMTRLLSDANDGWSHTQAEPFDSARLIPINDALTARSLKTGHPAIRSPDIYVPHEGVAPFWHLGGPRDQRR